MHLVQMAHSSTSLGLLVFSERKTERYRHGLPICGYNSMVEFTGNTCVVYVNCSYQFGLVTLWTERFNDIPLSVKKILD